MAQQPLLGKDLHIIEASQTQTHRTLLDTSGLEISPTQRLPPDNTQHPQQRDIYIPSRIRIRNSAKRAAGNQRLDPAVTGIGHSAIY